MKVLKKSTFSILLISIIFSIIFPITTHASEKDTCDSIIVLDSNSKTPLPDRFRSIKSLNISGSAQFTPSQLPNISSKINSPKLFIVDLRQESHGFINNIAISFYNPYRDLNNGFSTGETMSAEKRALNSIPLDKKVTIYSKTTRPLLKVLVSSVSDEANVIRGNGLNYVRFAVKDGFILDPTIVDKFVALVKNQVKNSHLHFHCDSGAERTTTFLSMYQMMKNTNNLSLDEILVYQVSIGGIVLTDSNDRHEFLSEFYRYTRENMKNNFRVPYSKWIQSPATKYNENTQ